MFKILTFTDVHLADKNPISRKDSYRETILGKLEQIREIASKKKVDLCLCGGDVFHIKSPIKTSHYLVTQTMSIFKSFPCPVFGIYGNHDISQDNVGTLPKQPFYTLMKSGALKYLTDETFQKGAIRVFGMDYCSEAEYLDFNRKNNGEKVQICVAHVNASSKFSDLFGERVYTYQELQNTSPDIFVFGHYHPDQDIEVLNEKHFVNVGSISRGSLKKDELDRIPSIGYIEIDDEYNISCEKIKLNVLPSSEIFDLEEKEKEDKEQEEIEKFVKEMKDSIVSTEEEDVAKTIKGLNFEKAIINKALEYYER